MTGNKRNQGAAATVDHALSRWREAKGRRANWDGHWEELARVFLPRRLGFASARPEGERRTEKLFDGTPMQAARSLANAIGGLLRPEGQPWFALRADDDAVDGSEEARAWLANAEAVLRCTLDNPRARFRQATGEADLDLTVFGTAVLHIGEDRTTRSLLYQCVHLKDVWVRFDDGGNPEGLFRRRALTARQAEVRFGREHLGETARKLLDRDRGDEQVEYLNAVLPRPGGEAGALSARRMPFASAWIEVADRHLVEESGYREFPFVVPRWDTSSGEDYGRSPAMIALPDANTLQAMGETLLVAAQRQADPPLMVPNDGSFSAANTFPGGISYYDVEIAAQVGGRPIYPLDTGINMPIGREMQSDIRGQVMAAFFKNVLNLPLDGPQMTATEINQRKEEFIREIGAVFGRLESDYTAPLVERTIGLLLRRNAFGPMPASLQGGRLHIEYQSPIKRLRQQVDAMAARAWKDDLMSLAAVEPGALALLDVDAYARLQAEAAGVPSHVVRPAEAAQGIRAMMMVGEGQ